MAGLREFVVEFGSEEQDVFFDAAEGGDATRSGPVSGDTARTSGLY